MGTSILVVEQESEMRAFLKTVLEQRGFDVHLTCDIKEALEKMSYLSPDLIILDLLFQDENSVTLIPELEPHPVIYISALPLKSILFRHKFFDCLEAFKKSGTIPFLEKPLQEDELLSLIHTVIPKNLTTDTRERG